MIADIPFPFGFHAAFTIEGGFLLRVFYGFLKTANIHHEIP